MALLYRTAMVEQSPRSTAASRHRGPPRSPRGRPPRRRPGPSSSDHAEGDCVGVHVLARRPSRRRGHRVLTVLVRPARRPGRPEAEDRRLPERVRAHHGRAADEGMAGALPTADHPFTGIMNAAPSSVAYSSTNPELRRAHRRGAARGRRGSAVPTMRRPRQAGPPKAFPAPFRIAQSMIRALTTTELRLSLTTLEEHRARAGDEVVVRLGGWRSVGRRVPL